MLHEGPFQASRRACSRTLKGVFHNLEWPPLYLRTMKIAYKHTLLNSPKATLPRPQPHSVMSTPPACITTNPFLFVHEIMITHHQPQSLSSTIPLCPIYKLILYHPLNPWYFVHELTLISLQTLPTLPPPQRSLLVCPRPSSSQQKKEEAKNYCLLLLLL